MVVKNMKKKERVLRRNYFWRKQKGKQINLKILRNSMKIEALEQRSTVSPPYIFGTSVIGPIHKQLDIPCQDACASEVFSGYSIIAVADGLGSAKKSDIGANEAVKTAVQMWKTFVSNKSKEINFEKVLNKIVFSARKALETKASEEQCDLQDLACTIIIVLAFEDNICIAHIGDGAVVAKTDQELLLVSEPGESEYINEVVPLTSRDWEIHLRITKIISNIECVAAFSDGCQRASLLNKQNLFQPYDHFFYPLFHYAQELDDLKQGEEQVRKFLSSQIMSDTSEDDKTLMVLVLKNKVHYL
jgi:hypothetical protein